MPFIRAMCLICFIAFSFSVFSQSALECKCTSTFPTTADTLDYKPDGYYVRVGIGEEASKGKVLVKGSPDWPTYEIIQANEQVASGKLKAPDYTTVVDVKPSVLTVRF